SASSASTPPKRMPLMTASRRKISMAASESHIGAADMVVARELARDAAQADMAAFEQVGAIDDVEHLLHVLLDDQYGEAFAANAPPQLEHLLDDEGRQARRRLVHQQDFRL